MRWVLILVVGLAFSSPLGARAGEMPDPDDGLWLYAAGALVVALVVGGVTASVLAGSRADDNTAAMEESPWGWTLTPTTPPRSMGSGL